MARIKKTPIRRAKPPTPVKLPSVKAARASAFEALGEGVADLGDALEKKRARGLASSRRGRGAAPDGYNQVKSLMDKAIKDGFGRHNATDTQGEQIRGNWEVVKARLQKSNPQLFTDKVLSENFDYLTKNADYVPVINGLREGLVGDNLKSVDRVHTITPVAGQKITTQGGQVVRKEKLGDDRPFLTYKTGLELRSDVSEILGREVLDKVGPDWNRRQDEASLKAFESQLLDKVASGKMSKDLAEYSLERNVRLGNLNETQRADLYDKVLDAQTKGLVRREKGIAAQQAKNVREVHKGIREFGRDARAVEDLTVAQNKDRLLTRINKGEVPPSVFSSVVEAQTYTTPIAKNRLRREAVDLFEQREGAIWGVGTQRPGTPPFLDFGKDPFQPPQEAGQAGEWFSDFMYMEMAKNTPNWSAMSAVERHSRVRSSMTKVGLPITTSMGQWVDNNYTKFNSNAKSWALARAVTSGDQASVDKILNLPDTSGGGTVNSSNYVARPEEMKVRQTGVNKLMNKAMDMVKGK